MNTRTNVHDYASYSLDKLEALLRQTTFDTAASIRLACEVLAEMQRRKHFSPLMKNGMLKYFRQVCDETLSPLALFILSGSDEIITSLIGLPLEQQEEFARGAPVPLIERDARGEPIRRDKPLSRMSGRDLARAFDKGRVRSLDEQKEVLRKEAAPKSRGNEPGSRIGVDVISHRLLIGRSTYAVEELREPLRQLGYDLVWTKKSNKAKVV